MAHMDQKPVIAPETALSPLDSSRLQAELNLKFAQEELARRVVDPTISTKALLDIAEHSFKVSGMAAKNQPKEAGTGFSITINIPQVGASPAHSMVLEATSVKDAATDDYGLPALPSYLLTASSGNLSAVASANE